jgi:glutaredoxin-related protein
MSEKKPFNLNLCPKGQELLDEYKKIKAEDERINQQRHGKILQNLKKYNALKNYVDHRNECKKCWDSRQGDINE